MFVLGIIGKLYFDYLARKAGEEFGIAVKWLLDHGDEKFNSWVILGVGLLEEKIGDDISEQTPEIKKMVEDFVRGIPVAKLFPSFCVKTVVIVLKSVDAKAKELK